MMSKNINDKMILFDGDDSLFKKYLKNCDVYFEYGVGNSTRYLINNTKAKIVAVDTDKKWINTIDVLRRKEDIIINWVDLGELENWGRPKSYLHRDKFFDYISGVWNFNLKADLILIDGRFRVACFLYSIMCADEGTIIFFDDYVDRGYYHIVEDIIPKSDCCGRQAMFKVPNNFNRELAKELLNKFVYVFD